MNRTAGKPRGSDRVGEVAAQRPRCGVAAPRRYGARAARRELAAVGLAAVALQVFLVPLARCAAPAQLLLWLLASLVVTLGYNVWPKASSCAPLDLVFPLGYLLTTAFGALVPRPHF